MNKSTKSQRAREKWSALIAEQAASGLSVPKFCAPRAIPPSSMFGWRRKLAEEASGARGTVPSAFVEARVSSGGCLGSGGGVTIELAMGRRVSVARGFDSGLLLEVLGALESGAATDSGPGARGRVRGAPGDRA